MVQQLNDSQMLSEIAKLRHPMVVTSGTKNPGAAIGRMKVFNR
jgi:hypothetical protein